MSLHLITNIVAGQKMFKNITAIGILIGAIYIMFNLGFWQLDRLEWKTEILSKIEKFESVDASVTPLDLSNTQDFQRGYVKGRFLNKSSIQIKPRTNDKGEVGYHIISPFKTNTGETLIVNTGWYNDETITHKNETKLMGYLRTADKQSSFTPKNNIEQNQFYSIDLKDLEELYGTTLFDKILYLDSAFPTMQKPRNKHAQYATFWFGMSGLLLFLAGFFVYRQRHK